MARSNMKAEAFIKTNDGQEIPWYTVYEDGSVVWHLSEDKAKEYKRLMMKHAGENMSMYLISHPEASLWGRTNQ